MTERWRCFVAVPIGDDLRDALTDAVAGWRSRPDLDGLRWADPGGWHVTVAFLGAIDSAGVPEIERVLGEVTSRLQPSSVHSDGLGGFPSAARARVAWYGVDDGEGKLRALSRGVRAALALEDGPFRAHVTFARARRDPVDLRQWLADTRPPSGVIAIDRIQLMRSHLGRGPARYEVLSSSVLGVPAGV